MPQQGPTALSSPLTPRSPRATLAPLVLAAAILGAGVAGVYAYGAAGTGLFVSMIETGLAWCF